MMQSENKKSHVCQHCEHMWRYIAQSEVIYSSPASSVLMSCLENQTRHVTVMPLCVTVTIFHTNAAPAAGLW